MKQSWKDCEQTAKYQIIIHHLHMYILNSVGCSCYANDKNVIFYRITQKYLIKWYDREAKLLYICQGVDVRCNNACIICYAVRINGWRRTHCTNMKKAPA